jgi:hypothetical protein
VGRLRRGARPRRVRRIGCSEGEESGHALYHRVYCTLEGEGGLYKMGLLACLLTCLHERARWISVHGTCYIDATGILESQTATRSNRRLQDYTHTSPRRF